MGGDGVDEGARGGVRVRHCRRLFFELFEFMRLSLRVRVVSDIVLCGCGCVGEKKQSARKEYIRGASSMKGLAFYELSIK